jgi:hypothetical protein
MENLQDRSGPANSCFACGPAYEKGLRIKSFVKEGHPAFHRW